MPHLRYLHWLMVRGTTHCHLQRTTKWLAYLAIFIYTACSTRSATATELVLSDFNGIGFDYQFSGFNQDIGPSTVRLEDPIDGWGGAGISQSLNLSGYADSRFIVDMYLNPGNGTDQFDLELLDSSGRTGKWTFDVSSLDSGVSSTLTATTALANPTHGIGDFQNLDLANITSWQILGDYSSPNPFDMNFDRVAISEAPDYPGQESTAAWRSIAESRIDTHRKADLQIKVTDSLGNPINGADVSIEMQEHEFGFGSAVQAFRLRDNNPNNNAYKQKTSELFNLAVLENNLKWPTWEGEWGSLWTQQGAQNAIAWLAGQDIPVRGHTLVWPGYNNLPIPVKNLLDSSPLNSHQQQLLRDAIHLHISDIASTFAGQLAAWDVINEVRANHDVMDNLSEGNLAMVDWFLQAEAIDPTSTKYINDYGILTSAGATNSSNQQHYADTIQFLLNNNAPIGGIGFQSHFAEQTLTGPEDLWTILDRFHQYGLDMQVTEFDFNTTNEALQADYTRDFMTAMFAHEGVDSVLHWGFWEDAHWRPNAAMYRSDWSIKPNGQAYLDLVFGEWWTDENLQSKVDGLTSLRGFKGEYEITVTHNGEEHVLLVTLADDGVKLRSLWRDSALISMETATSEPTIFAILFSNYGLTTSAIQTTGDANGDGHVDGGDFLEWQRQYRSSAVATLMPVPEPSTLLLIGLVCSCLSVRRLRMTTLQDSFSL